MKNKNIYTGKIGLYRGEIPRISLEANRLKDSDFTPGTKIHIDVQPRKITFTKSYSDEKQSVTSRNGKPVIDMKDMAILDSFGDIREIKITVGRNNIVITPLFEGKEQSRARKKANKKGVLTALDLFGGGGAMAHCMTKAGIKVVGAVDFNEKVLLNYSKNNPDAQTWCSDISRVYWNAFKDVDIIHASPSCKPYTKSNTRGKKKENHDEGDLTYFVIEAMRIIRPALLIVEQVPEYAGLFSAILLKSILERIGYHISEKMVDNHKYGGISTRRRYCMVASIKEGFSFTSEEKIISSSLLPRKRVSDILEIPVDEREWKDLSHFDEWAENNKLNGRNFKTNSVLLEGIKVWHPTTRYYSRQTSSVLRESEESNRRDFFTGRELANVAGLGRDFIIPEDDREAAFIIGNGVAFESFYAVSCDVVRHLQAS